MNTIRNPCLQVAYVPYWLGMFSWSRITNAPGTKTMSGSKLDRSTGQLSKDICGVPQSLQTKAEMSLD